uniref:MaoC family dehydratase n=1 Tax=Orrella sp. TaxID=1921583 RepID=UPI004048B07F
MAGLYFEQFEVNHVFKHEITRSLTESDNMLFCNMTLNPQPLHIDFNFAKDTEFGQPLVNSLFTLGLVIGISVYDTTLGTTIANLGMENTQFPNPVFHGDTIRVETRVVSLRESKSRPMAGIVVFEHKGINQRGDVVCLCTRSAFMRKRPK